MNFKERVRRALRQPTRFAGGGYIRDAGGGDQIVYGSTHNQGGVDRGPDVELEGGGFDPVTGQPLQGEVITNIQDASGNMNEFYMSDQNGVALVHTVPLMLEILGVSILQCFFSFSILFYFLLLLLLVLSQLFF